MCLERLTPGPCDGHADAVDQAAHLGDGSLVDARVDALATPAAMPLDDESRRVAYARNAVTAMSPA